MSEEKKVKTTKKAHPKAKEVKEAKAHPETEKKHATTVVEKVPVKKKHHIEPSKDYFFGTGRRKTSVARIILRPGKGLIIVNGKGMQEFFVNRHILLSKVVLPLELTSLKTKFNIMARVHGGGVAAQADAIQMGISRALIVYSPALKMTLRKGGCLTRDSRMKERKKYGHKRARKSFQFSKR